jgi:23S rRNA (uracil-5-)-methyltransferase RumA
MSLPNKSHISHLCSKTGFGKFSHLKKSFSVKGVYPGEEFTYTLARNKKAVDQIELVAKSHDRSENFCPHFDQCGGCSLLGLSINAQQKWKQILIEELFHLDLDKIFPIITNPLSFHYRNKVEMTFSQNLKNEKKLGFIQFQSRGFAFSTSTCLLIPNWMIEIKKITEDWFCQSTLEAFYLPKMTGNLKNLIMRSNRDQSEWIVALVVQDKEQISLDEQNRWIQAIESHYVGQKIAYFLVENKVQKGVATTTSLHLIKGKDAIKEVMKFDFLGKKFDVTMNINPLSFFQPNFETAQIIYQKAIESLELSDADRVLDLYCGSGTFGIIASHFAKKVIGIEINPNAVLDGNASINENKISNMEILLGDAKIEIKKLLNHSLNKMILDPPRAGLESAVIEVIERIRPEKIVYVSCNPKTQKEDVIRLNEIGYKVEKIQPVDQFTHTPHIENIVVLKNIKND